MLVHIWEGANDACSESAPQRLSGTGKADPCDRRFGQVHGGIGSQPFRQSDFEGVTRWQDRSCCSQPTNRMLLLPCHATISNCCCVTHRLVVDLEMFLQGRIVACIIVSVAVVIGPPQARCGSVEAVLRRCRLSARRRFVTAAVGNAQSLQKQGETGRIDKICRKA